MLRRRRQVPPLVRIVAVIVELFVAVLVADVAMVARAHRVVAELIGGDRMVRPLGFRLFERLMAACIGVLFVTVVVTALACAPDWGQVAGDFAVETTFGAWSMAESLSWCAKNR